MRKNKENHEVEFANQCWQEAGMDARTTYKTKQNERAPLAPNIDWRKQLYDFPIMCNLVL